MTDPGVPVLSEGAHAELRPVLGDTTVSPCRHSYLHCIFVDSFRLFLVPLCFSSSFALFLTGYLYLRVSRRFSPPALFPVDPPPPRQRRCSVIMPFLATLLLVDPLPPNRLFHPLS